MFNTPGLTDLLSQEIVKNLAFLGQCAGVTDLKWKTLHKEEENASDDEDELVEDSEQEQDTALNYLFRRLSFILRREISPPRSPALISKTAALQLMEILCKNLSAEVLFPSLHIILLPLHNFSDPNIPTPYLTDELFKAGYEALKTNSQELMSLLQKKLGTANYTAQLLKVIEGVKARRNARSSKRKIEAVAAPEKFGRDKKKKVERKKERRKEKGLEHRDRRRGW
jgi:U3 small nucleolar RNA-associated protein 20